MMILVNFLVATTLTTLVQSTPLLYSTNHRREPVNEDHDVYVPYLINGRGASVNDIYWQQLREEENAKIKNGSTIDGIGQIKRAHSLSVTNSIDVLRDQLLLALARRKALQSQQQIQANRRYLDSIGKRSLKNSAINSPQNFEMKNKHLFGNQFIENPARNQSPFESHLDESIDWYNIGDVGDVYEKDNQLQEMAIDEFGVL